MRFDVDLHRYTIKLPIRLAGGKPLEMSVVDAGTRDAAQTMIFIHGFGYSDTAQNACMQAPCPIASHYFWVSALDRHEANASN